jgi:hypothetical protein
MTLFSQNEYSDFLKEQTKLHVISDTNARESLTALDVLINYVDIEGEKLDDINKIISLFVERAKPVLADNTLRFYLSRISNSLNLFLKSRSKPTVDVSSFALKQQSPITQIKKPPRIIIKKPKRIFVPDDIKIAVSSNDQRKYSVEKNDVITTPSTACKHNPALNNNIDRHKTDNQVKKKTIKNKIKKRKVKKRRVASKNRPPVKQAFNNDKLIVPIDSIKSSDSTESFESTNNYYQYVFPVPIREDLMILIKNLPSNLSVSESRRICSIVKALSI